MIDSPSAKNWLNQFSETDRELANLTLRHLEFHGSDEVARDLGVELEIRLKKSFDAGHEVIMETAVSREDIRRHLGENGSYDQVHMYSDFFLSEVRDVESGSEKYLDLIVRRMREQWKSDSEYRVRATRDEICALRANGIPTDLFIITDNIGSGNQIIRLLDKLFSAWLAPDNPISSRDLHVIVLAWASTSHGQSVIEEWFKEVEELDSNANRGNIFKVEFVALRRIRSFKEKVDASELDDLMDFFSRYCSGVNSIETKGQGYREICSTLVLAGSSCPNTVPELLIDRIEDYEPIFPGRRIPADVAEWVSCSNAAESKLPDKAFRESLRKNRLVQASRRPGNGSDGTWEVLLTAVAGMRRMDSIIHLEMPHHKFRDIESRLVENGWILSDFSATRRGDQIVREYGRKSNYADYASARRFLAKSVANESVTYYPKSVRGVR